MIQKLSSFKRATAKKLRQRMTPEEIKLWHALKRIPLYGTHFRRQVPIGNFVADFACLATRLVIELDGSQHALPQNITKDIERTYWLESEGYKVLRFWNGELKQNLEGVLETINSFLITPPRHASHADPPPQGEGKESRPHA